MGQSFNLQALREVATILRKPSLLLPNLTVPDIRSINFNKLKAIGIKAVVFDKDNTLSEPYKNSLHLPFTSAMNECRRCFPGKIAIVSNSAGSSDDRLSGHKQAQDVLQKMDIPVFIHNSKKPAKPELLIEYFKCNGDEIVVVGDRILTDIVYGNKIGAFTILTTKIISHVGDNPLAIAIRKMENWILGLTKLRSKHNRRYD